MVSVVVVVVVVVKRPPKGEERETTPDHIDPPGNPAVRCIFFIPLKLCSLHIRATAPQLTRDTLFCKQ